MITRVSLFLLSILNKYIPKSNKKNLFISSPDFSDNSFALFKFMIEHYKEREYIWLVDDEKFIQAYRVMLQEYIDLPKSILDNVQIVSKRSLRGMWVFVRAKYVFFTHGFYTGVSLPKTQIRVNLWHGMPLKAIGYLNDNGDVSTIPHFTYTIATSEVFQKIMSKVFQIDKSRVLITGQPRYDFLNGKYNCLERLGINKEQFKKIIFWAPTYRTSIDGRIVDGDNSIDTSVLKKLNLFAAKKGICIVIKLHPMDSLNRKYFETFTHLKVIKNDDMLHSSCQLFALLGEVDILVTDFSSIYIDFLLLERPIVFYINDLEQYRVKRGFAVDNPLEWMPGEKVQSINKLQEVLSKILDGNDRYFKDRRKLATTFHRYKNDFSKRVLEGIGYE